MPFFKRKSDKKSPSSPSKTPEIRTPVIAPKEEHSVPVANGDILGSPERTLNAWGARPRSLLLSPNVQSDSESGDEDDLSLSSYESSLNPQTPVLTSSRLSKTLYEVLHDKDALPYFIQYMHSRNAGHIIKFWLDASSFQASAWTRIRSSSLKERSRSTSSARSCEENSPEGATKGDGISRDGSVEGLKANDTDSGRVNGETKRTGSPSGGDHGIHAGQSYSSESGPTATSASSTSTATSSGVNPARTSPDERQECVCAHTNTASSGVTSPSPGCPLHSKDLASPTHLYHRPEVSGTDASPVPYQAHSRNNHDPSSSSPEYQTHTDSGVSHRTTSSTSHQGACPSSNSPTTNTSGQLCDSTSSAKTNSPSSPEPSLPTPVQEANAPDDTLQDKLRKSIAKDAVSIYSKYIAQDCSHPIGISDHLRNETISKICREDGQVDPACFVTCQEFVVKRMDNQFFPEFLQSEFHCKHQVDILTERQVHLADVLFNEAALSYFMEFMDQEGVSDLLQCWLAMENFQQQLSEQHGQYDTNEAQKDAMVIYDKYFSLQASNPLGFDDPVRFEVEGNICREGGPLPDCFSTPKRHVLRTLEKRYFPQFVKGELYLKYLTELINTIQLSADLPQIKRKRTGSDASSEHSNQSANSEAVSISSRNTLLASESAGGGKSNKNLKKALNMIDDDMRIDTMLFNPDSLWLRPQSGRMSMGKVNEVGQFISELEIEPDRDKGLGAIAANTIFKKKADKEKTQEEMALKVAQRILEDVTNATQGIYPQEEDFL